MVICTALKDCSHTVSHILYLELPTPPLLSALVSQRDPPCADVRFYYTPPLGKKDFKKCSRSGPLALFIWTTLGRG